MDLREYSNVEKNHLVDESPLCKVNSTNKRFCRRKVTQELDLNNLKATFKFGGGKIMMWGCFPGKEWKK